MKRISTILNRVMRLGRRTHPSKAGPAHDPNKEVAEMRTIPEEKMPHKLETRLDKRKTEPAADNLGRGTATGPAEVRPSEHTHQYSNIPDVNDQSIMNWPSFNLSDAYKERAPIEFIVGNIFPLPSLSIVYGSPGSFKSFLLADLACCIAGNIDWLPPFGDPIGKGQPVSQGGAVWIDFDNGKRRTLDRFKALGSTMQLPEDVPLKIYSMPYPIFDARNQIQVIELQVQIALHETKLVILDNLAMISGNADENSADMAEIFNNLRQISEITGTAVVVIHHPRKGSHTQGREGDRLRGHSSIEAAIDLALYTKRSGNDLMVDIKPTKARDSLVEPFSARFVFEVDRDDQLTKARFYSITGSISNQTVKVMEVIWEALADDDLNKGDLTSRVKKLLDDNDANNVGENNIRKTVMAMHDQGFLKMNKGKNNAQLFSRNSDKPYEKFPDEKGVSP